MNTRLQTGTTQTGLPPRGPARAAAEPVAALACRVLGFALAACLVTGCSTTQKQAGDPLVGEYFPKGANGQPLPPPPAKTTTSSIFPGFPPASSAASTAAIANNTNLPGGKQLAIPQPNWMLTSTPKTGTPTVVPVPRVAAGPNDNNVVAAGSWAGKDTPTATPQANAPQPQTSPFPSATPPTSPQVNVPQSQPSPFPAANSPANAADLEKLLQAKGATNIRVEPVAGGVRASCLVPYFNNPSNLRFHETTAPDAVAALQAILAQVEAR